MHAGLFAFAMILSSSSAAPRNPCTPLLQDGQPVNGNGCPALDVNDLTIDLATAPSNAPRPTCDLPDDGNPTHSHGCPAVYWQDSDGGYEVPQKGESVWVDAHGVLHMAKRRQDVPEPYRTMYQDLRRDGDGTYHVVDGMPGYVPYSGPAEAASPYATAQARERQAWRNEVTYWRNELYVSSRALLQAVLHTYGDAYNPLAFAYMPSRDLQQTAQEHDATAARARVLHARAMLLDELPARARQAGVPTQWLL